MADASGGCFILRWLYFNILSYILFYLFSFSWNLILISILLFFIWTFLCSTLILGLLLNHFMTCLEFCFWKSPLTPPLVRGLAIYQTQAFPLIGFGVCI